MPGRLLSMEVSDDQTITLNGDAPIARQAHDDSTNRRKSGRVSRKPQAFTPEPNTVSTTKRKRHGQHDGTGEGDDASDLTGAESESDESEDEPAEEETRDRKRKSAAVSRNQKTPAAKKPKVQDGRAAKQLPVRTAPKKTTAKARKQRSSQAAFSDSQGLFADVFSKGSTVDALAASWLSRYDASAVEAMRDLVNFFLEAAGCTIEVTVHDIEDQDNVTGKLTDLQEEYHAQKITEYPLISKKRSTPPFRQTLTAFIHSLIATMHASSVLYDDLALIETIQVWITTMSSSALRPFRHTATVIALSIVNALCDIAGEITDSNAKVSRQLEGEKKKARGNKGRIAELQAKVDEAATKREAVEGTIRDIFETVFVHRYRDVDPRIRAECVQALGYWIHTLPDVFFEGQYLRYLGWVLSDTSAPTRLEVIKQLQRLFKVKDNVGGLRTFTERFRPRLIEMATRDAEAGVRASTVELVDMIREAGLLEPDDIDAVGRLMFDAEPRVRKAVVNFFVENVNELYESKLEELGGEEVFDDILAREGDDDYDNPRVSWLKLKCLVEVLQSYDLEDSEQTSGRIGQGFTISNGMLIASDLESRFSSAAQALYHKIPEVKEWQLLAGYILFDHSETPAGAANAKRDDPETLLKKEFRLDEKEEMVLLEVLNAAVKLNLTQADTDGADAAKKGKKKRGQVSDALEAQETTARQLAQLIPRLLKKFGATPATASSVLRLEHVLNLDVFQELRQDSTTFAALLDDINRQFMTHGDQSVLAEASAALLHAKGFEELDEITEGKVQHLWEDTLATLQTLSKAGNLSSRGGLSANVLTGVAATVRRISTLAGISDCIEPLETLPPVKSSNKKSGKDRGGHMNPLQTLLELLGRGVTHGGQVSKGDVEVLEDDVVSGSMKALLFYFMWKCGSARQRLSDGEPLTELHLAELGDNREKFGSQLIRIIRSRNGVEGIRCLSVGTLLDLYTLLATLRRAAGSTEGIVDEITEISSLVKEIPAEHQTLLLSVFVATEKAFASKSRRTLEAGDEDEPADDDDLSDSDNEDEDDDGTAERDRQSMALISEQRLCELTGKMVLAIIARVLDTSGPGKGKITERLRKNRGRLGPNYSQVIAHLDQPKAKKPKRAIIKEPVKSADLVRDEEDEDGSEGAPEHVEEGGDDDLRNREIVAEDGDVRSEDDEAADAEPVAEEDIMGD